MRKDEFALNLTVPSLLSAVKYARTSGEEKAGRKIRKKAGYFKSEEAQIEKAYRLIGWPKGFRYPLTYIMEAADDISYCLSDVSDAIAKGIITPAEFLKEFHEMWEQKYGREEIPVKSLAEKESVRDFGVEICIEISHRAVEAAAEAFVRRYDTFATVRRKS